MYWVWQRSMVLCWRITGDELQSTSNVYAMVLKDGIHEMWTSLYLFESPRPMKHWILMPKTSILIANRFGVVLNLLNKLCSITFFSLWKVLKDFLYHRIITISLVHDNHYVMILLEGHCTMPTISIYWICHKAPCAVGWKTMVMSHLQFYWQLKHCNHELINIFIFK